MFSRDLHRMSRFSCFAESPSTLPHSAYSVGQRDSVSAVRTRLAYMSSVCLSMGQSVPLYSLVVPRSHSSRCLCFPYPSERPTGLPQSKWSCSNRDRSTCSRSPSTLASASHTRWACTSSVSHRRCRAVAVSVPLFIMKFAVHGSRSRAIARNAPKVQ
jgi:hypothetical protein